MRRLLNQLRHCLSLTLDLLPRKEGPAPAQRRSGSVVWSFDPVERYGQCRNIEITGIMRDFNGGPPPAIYARLGARTIDGTVQAIDDEGNHPFVFAFTSRRPGLKFVSFFARLASGETLTLGHWLYYNPAPSVAFRPRAAPIELPDELPSPESIILPDADAPEVSIVIPVYNQTAYTLSCLLSISRNTKGHAYEIIVVDDCSPEPNISLLAQVPRLRVHRNATNLGFVRNCNLGANIARGRHLVLLNNDVMVQAGWLDALLSTREKRPDAGLVGAKLLYPDGSLQEAGGIVWRDGSGANYGRNQDPSLPEYNYLKEADYCSGACLLVDRGFFLQLGGFDTLYAPAYYEDTDLAFRVRRHGKKVYYQPRCEIIHFEGKSNGTDTHGTGVKRYQAVNREKFIGRWREELNAAHAPANSGLFKVRDRSLSRPTVLIIDHYVPRPDQDAGSRSVDHLVDFFVAADFNVKFLPHDLAFDEHYTNALCARGVEVLDQRAGPAFSFRHWLRENGRHIDYVILSRAHIAVHYLKDLSTHSRARLMLFGHDLLSRTLARTYETTGDLDTRKQSLRWQEWEGAVFKKVHAAYYPSTVEIESLRETHPQLRARMLPLLTYPAPSTPAPAASDFIQRTGILFVGGFGHPPNLEAIRWFLAEVWPLVSASSPGIQLDIAGSRSPTELLSLKDKRVRVHGFVSDTRLTELYRSARIVIVPLRNGGGVKGKVLEALWHGVPVLTTPVGAEGITDMSSALQVAEPGEFAAKLALLYERPDRLAELASAGHRLLEKHFSKEAFRAVLAQDIRELRPLAPDPKSPHLS